MTKLIVRLMETDIDWLSKDRMLRFPVYDENGKRTHTIELSVTDDETLHGVETMED